MSNSKSNSKSDSKSDSDFDSNSDKQDLTKDLVNGDSCYFDMDSLLDIREMSGLEKAAEDKKVKEAEEKKRRMKS